MAGAALMAVVAAGTGMSARTQAKGRERRQVETARVAQNRQDLAQDKIKAEAKSERMAGDIEQRRLKKKRPGLIDETGGRSGQGLDSTFLTGPIQDEGGRPLLGGARSLGGR